MRPAAAAAAGSSNSTAATGTVGRRGAGLQLKPAANAHGAFDPASAQLHDARFIDSMASTMTSTGSTLETASSSGSTVKVVLFREPHGRFASQPDLPQKHTDYIRATGTGALPFDHMSMSQSYQIDTVLTDDVMQRHPRAALLLACVQAALGMHILLFAVICAVYGGCPYLTAIWMAVLFVLNAAVGLTLLRYYARRPLLLTYLAGTLACVFLSVLLFVLTGILLKTEDTQSRNTAAPVDAERRGGLLVRDVRVAMYTMLLILTPVHCMCCSCTSALLYGTWRDMETGRITRAYYLSQSTHTHQQVLVPIHLEQVKRLPPHVARAQALANADPVRHANAAVQTNGAVL